MHGDELILTEDEYLSSARLSAGVSASAGGGVGGPGVEWCLMYSRGVPVVVIARWCRVDRRRVERAITQRSVGDSGWFGRCWVVHDQPASSPVGWRVRVGREQVWWDRYSLYAAHVQEYGRVPSQLTDLADRSLYKWVQAQRRAHRLGKLSAGKGEALDRVGEWGGAPRGNLEVLWQTRLREVEAFRGVYGWFPIYDPVRRPGEKVLAVWVGRQRTWSGKGVLRTDRWEQLDEVVPGWDVPDRLSPGRGVDAEGKWAPESSSNLGRFIVQPGVGRN